MGGLFKTHDDFVSEVYTLVGDEYEVTSNYLSSKTKLTIKHSVCGYEHEIVPYSFLRGTRCPKCANLLQKDTSRFKEDVLNKVGTEYVVLGEYINNKSKISINHILCGTTYYVRPIDILNGKRCPTCNESKGEQAVARFIRKHKITALREFSYPDCKDVRILPFDFAVCHNDNVIALIEYDGQQHYQVVNHFGGESRLLDTQRKDAIKTQYCADNGIPLIRIPYWDYDNIDDILTEKLLPLLKDADKHNAS